MKNLVIERLTAYLFALISVASMALMIKHFDYNIAVAVFGGVAVFGALASYLTFEELKDQ
jgi:multidrug transporter EmrE-like cation transporter